MLIMQQSSRINVEELRSLIALADTGSFVAAGRRLSQDASMVSRRLQALERRLGIRLAERTTRRVELTEAGIAYLERVRPLLLDLEHAEQEVAALAGGEPSGHLRISLPGNFGAAWLGRVIATFLLAHPRITMEADTTNSFVNVIEERYDAVIRLGTLADSRLVARKVADRRRLLCAAPNYIARHGVPLHPGELAAHACLYSTGRADPGRWCFRNKSEPAISVAVSGPFASSNAQLLVDAAREGLGVLYTSDWYVGPDLASGKLVEVLPDYPVAEQGSVYVVTPAAKGTPSKTRAFSDWLAVELKNAPWRTP